MPQARLPLVRPEAVAIPARPDAQAVPLLRRSAGRVRPRSHRMRPQPAIVVMAKAPRSGTVKTRLMPYLSADDAAALAARFVADAVSRVSAIACQIIVAYAPADGRKDLADVLPTGLTWHAQQGRDLGERMAEAIETAAAGEGSPVAVIGADIPTLPPEHIMEAIRRLQDGSADVALGPTEDGGYYLAAVREPVAGLFDNVGWSTAAAFAHTADNVRRLGLQLHTTPTCYDVDEPADLRRLEQELRAFPSMRSLCPATYDWIMSRRR